METKIFLKWKTRSWNSLIVSENKSLTKALLAEGSLSIRLGNLKNG